MDKKEIEDILTDAESLKKLLDLAATLKPREESRKPPLPTLERAEPPYYLNGPTPEEIKKNQTIKRSLHLFDSVAQFIPEIANKSLSDALQYFVKKYDDDPTENNRDLLINAINRLTLIGKTDEESTRAITAATTALIRKHSEKHSPPAGDAIWAWFWVDSGFNGAMLSENLGDGPVYLLVPYVDDSMNDKISSLKIRGDQAEYGGNVILFENSNFDGKYQNYCVGTPAGVSGIPNHLDEDVGYVGNFINDLTSSIMIVRRFPNELPPTALSTILTKDMIKSLVTEQSPPGNHNIWPNGDPSITWQYNTSIDPNSLFVYIQIPIWVHMDWPWPNYSAQIRYWIYLYIDSSGKLQGYVHTYGDWVEAGTWSGQVSDGLMQGIKGSIDTVNSKINQITSQVNVFGPFSQVYYLPGRNQGNTLTPTQGNTWDDVSVVLVKK